MSNRFFSQLASGIFFRTCVALALFGCYTAQAEDVYVTDMLQLDMYATAEFSGSPIRKLRSGDHLSLIEERGRYVNVRADDGLVGWVTSLYLVKDEPARTRLNKLEKENGALESTAKKLRSQLIVIFTTIDLAEKKGHNKFVWGLLAFCASWIALLILACLPKQGKG